MISPHASLEDNVSGMEGHKISGVDFIYRELLSRIQEVSVFNSAPKWLSPVVTIHA